MRVFSRKEDRYVEVESRPLRDEAEMQRLFEQHSNLIPVPLDPLHQVIREFPTAAGPIDHLAIDATGALLVLETKLAKNADRRTVVAQAIDYAAQLTRYGPQALIDTARQRIGEDFTQAWFETLGQRDEFLRGLESNLSKGRLTLLIVMDRAEQRLKDAVRFMNRATHFTCMLAEIRIAGSKGAELVWVDLYGDESVEDKKPEGSIGRDRLVSLAADRGLEKEAAAFLEAVDGLDTEKADSDGLTGGYYVSPKPTVGYNYMGWTATRAELQIWATADVFEEMRKHLASAPPDWLNRFELRSLKEDGRFGKVANVEVAGATTGDFSRLLDHYLDGPRAQK